MTAIAEARALLDQLMGIERDAPIPEGAALPRKNKRSTDDGSMMILSSKKSRSCRDPDIDPIYCAWGIDVYDLFINTKSDLGANPYIVDDGAREEYLALSQEEKDKLGFEWKVFSKLQDLVSHCDRLISRNNEKLRREMTRQAQKKGSAVNMDYHVKDVKPEAVEELIRTEIRLQDLKDDVERTLAKLTLLRSKENAILKKQHQKVTDASDDGTATKVKEEDDVAEDEEKQQEQKASEEDGKDIKIKKEDAEEEKGDKKPDEAPSDGPKPSTDETGPNEDDLAELGRLTLEKQALLCQVADMISRITPTEDAIKAQLKHLNYVKSDTTTDKTVCEVSGNFMSARDADERIAAHYAGKQYVGWKLVRDKLKEMLKTYGRGGPPRPQIDHNHGRDAPPLMSFRGGGGGGGGNRYGGRDSRDGGRWERGGRGGGGGYDRRRGSDRRGGGYGGGGYGRR